MSRLVLKTTLKAIYLLLSIYLFIYLCIQDRHPPPSQSSPPPELSSKAISRTIVTAELATDKVCTQSILLIICI